MITNAVLYILYGVIYTIILPLRLLPDVSLDSNFGVAVDTANSYISAFNNFLPITTLLTIFFIFVVFEISYFTYKGIMWIIKKIPFIN